MTVSLTRRRGSTWGALWLLVSSISLAGPRTVTIAAGDCQNSELIAAAQTLSMAVASKEGRDAVEGDAVLEQFRPAPTVSRDEVGRQLEAAQNQFYAGEHDKALESLRQSSSAIERLSPRAEPWKLMTRSLMLLSMVQKAVGKKNESLETQRRLLRIEPGFALDPDYYTNATVQTFDGLRKGMAQAKKATLSVTSSPSGAQVFLDGAPVGKTPFVRALPFGNYRMALVHAEQVSFTHALKLTRDVAIQIDLAFEGALSPRSPLCVSAAPAQMIDTALKLAALAGADNAVVLGLETRNNEPGWANAALFEVSKGSKVREGGVRFVGAKRDLALTALAGFLLTGFPSAAQVAALAKPDEPSGPPPIPEVAAPAQVVEQPTHIEQRSPRGMGPRVVSLVLMGASLVGGISAAGVFAGGAADRAAISTLIDEQGRLKARANAEEALALQARIDRTSNTSLILGVGSGIVALVAGTVFFLLPPEGSAPLVSVVPLRDGIWAGAVLSF